MVRRVLFLTGTRADFGKLKSLIEITNSAIEFDAHIFITGMHMLSKYGSTSIEVERLEAASSYKLINQRSGDSMDVILAKTIQGLSEYVHENPPDLIVVHGDRIEAMAGAIVGSLNNILVAHVEGGEVSGTIDELIRHSISKMAHLHFVCNDAAKQRLIQLGENENSIFVIGSPDLDVMLASSLPSLAQAKSKYEIPFEEFSIFMYHPVTTALDELEANIKSVVDELLTSKQNYLVVYPNNDTGTDIILHELQRLKGHPRFKVYPSIRFEYFLTLLQNANCMIGNSSAGVREAPVYGIPSINLGSRQNNRATASSIYNVDEKTTGLSDLIEDICHSKSTYPSTHEFGDGNSANRFLEHLKDLSLWQVSKQKIFIDRH